MSAPTSDPLCAGLLQGMHTTAQPLAILSARFYPDYIEQLNEGELRELAMSAVPQIERVCTLFSYLQQLVLAASSAPKPVQVTVSSMVERATDGVDLWFQDSGMSLVWNVAEGCDDVLIDSRRTQQALSAVLMITHGLSKTGDTVKIQASPAEESVHLTIRNDASTTATLNGESSLGFAVAETHIRSQQGSVTCNLNPLTIEISLPKNPCRTEHLPPKIGPMAVQTSSKIETIAV